MTSEHQQWVDRKIQEERQRVGELLDPAKRNLNKILGIYGREVVNKTVPRLPQWRACSFTDEIGVLRQALEASRQGVVGSLFLNLWRVGQLPQVPAVEPQKIHCYFSEQILATSEAKASNPEKAEADFFVMPKRKVVITFDEIRFGEMGVTLFETGSHLDMIYDRILNPQAAEELSKCMVRMRDYPMISSDLAGQIVDVACESARLSQRWDSVASMFFPYPDRITRYR